MNDNAGSPSGPSDRVLAVLLGALVVPAVLVWLWSGIAGALFGSDWPKLDGAALAHVLVNLPGHLGDPRMAWPRPLRATLPGPAGFYGALTMLLLALAAAALLLVHLWRRARSSPVEKPDKHGARWARPTDLRVLNTPPGRRRKAPSDSDGVRLAIGFKGSRLLRTEQRHALVAFGPPQSGKSAGLAVGALLEWDGPAIASSIKTDVLQATIARRRQLGHVYVFDPFGLSGHRLSTWSPMAAVTTFDAALEVAHRIASAGEVDQRTVESGEFWTVAAEQRLAPLLYAAARTGSGVPALVRWGYGQGERELTDLLARLMREANTDEDRRDAQAAYDAAAAFRSQPDRTRGSIEGTVQTLLRAYRSTRVQESARISEIDPQGLLSGSNTLYLVGDAKASKLMRPIFLALLGELVDHAYRTANLNGGRLPTPLLLCLDELGNIAPLPNLSEIASTAPSHNIQLVSIFHDLAQARARYGQHAETVINSHRARMLLPGAADLATLQYFSGLVGEQIAREETHTTGSGGYRHRSEHQSRRPLAPAEQLRQLPDGHALLLYGRLPPTTVRLRMWFNDKHLSALAHA
jgi:type IV secretion system protein VirD4